MSEDLYAVVFDTLKEVLDGNQMVSAAFSRWLDIAEQAPNEMEWETALAVISAAREGTDVNAWVVGYTAASKIEDTEYGKKEEVLADLAAKTGHSVHDLRAKVDTARFWPPSIVKALLEKDGAEMLSWSHFDRARRGLEFEEACELIEESASSGWSVRQMERDRMRRRNKAQGKQDDPLLKKAKAFMSRAEAFFNESQREGGVDAEILGKVAEAYNLVEKWASARESQHAQPD